MRTLQTRLGYLGLLSILLMTMPSVAQVYNYDNDPDLAKALEYDSEMNGGDLKIADRAKAEQYYLAYLEKVTDTAQQVRVYAQLGALYAVAINPRKGEKPDYDKAKYYFEKVLELEPERIARPTIVARTQLAGLSEPGEGRMKAWMDFYRWMQSIEEEKLKDLWLPSRPDRAVPSETKLKGLKGLCGSVKTMAEGNMVSCAMGLPIPEVALLGIIETFPGTPAEKLARQGLREVMDIIEIRVAGILIHQGKILLAEHQKAGERYWVIPGGRLKFGETLKKALLREMKEETGLEVAIGKRMLINDFIEKGEKRQVLNIYFEVAPKEGLSKWLSKCAGRLRRTEFFSPEELGKITLRPKIVREILDILAGKWPKEIYLGNR